jgi:hypothetical protein
MGEPTRESPATPFALALIKGQVKRDLWVLVLHYGYDRDALVELVDEALELPRA